MYFAAMNSKPCRLTVLSEHYWNLIAKQRILFLTTSFAGNLTPNRCFAASSANTFDCIGRVAWICPDGIG